MGLVGLLRVGFWWVHKEVGVVYPRVRVRGLKVSVRVRGEEENSPRAGGSG